MSGSLWFVESISGNLARLVAEDGVSWRSANVKTLPEGTREGDWLRGRAFPILYDRDPAETEQKRKENQDLMDEVSS